MEKISNLVGKPVVSIYEGNIEGYVKGVFVDRELSKITMLSIFDDESQIEKFVNLIDLVTLGDDAVMIKNNQNILLNETFAVEDANPIGFKVFDIEGKYFGKIADVEFDENLTLQSIVLQDKQILNKSNVLKVGKNLIIKSIENKVKISKFKPKTRIFDKKQKNVKVEIQEDSTQKKPTRAYPKKVLTRGYEFLIGRKVGRNIYTENNQLIAKKQSKITSQTIDTASQNGKLKELTTYSVV